MRLLFACRQKGGLIRKLEPEGMKIDELQEWLSDQGQLSIHISKTLGKAIEKPVLGLILTGGKKKPSPRYVFAGRGR